jgi:hypothetical protein
MEWLTQCNYSYYYENKVRLNWLFVFHSKMEQKDIMKTKIRSN